VNAAGGSADDATLLLVTEQLPALVEEQAKAIANMKIDSVTVWDSGKGKDGKNDTAGFVFGLVGVIPPLHQLTKNVGIELPEFLGKLADNPENLMPAKEATPPAEEAAPAKKVNPPELPDTDGK